MDSASERLGVYRELADTYDRLSQASMRDRFMILAADAALEAGQPVEAEALRQRLLQASRYHMLRPYNSFAEAIQAPDVQTYLRDLRANYPLEVARQLLATLLPTGAVASAPAARQSPPAPLSIDPPPPEIYPMIPPTAPLIDIFGRQAPTARPTWQPTIAATEPLEMTPAPAMHRPLAQPVPGRPMPPRNPPMPQPLSALPPPARPRPLAPPPTPHHRSIEPSEPTGGSWLTFLLVGVVVVSGAALAAYTFARPFLPTAWRF
jgi:hypothetical protein